MPIFQQGGVSIYYEEHGSPSGFPIMLFPPGGFAATVDRWRWVAVSPIGSLSEYRVIVLDQRNAGRSSGPFDFDDPWAGYADDHLGLADHLGVDRFHVVGQCVGCSYALALAKRTPECLASAVLVQPIGLDESNRSHWDEPNRPDWLKRFLASHFFEAWSEELMRKRQGLDMAMLEKFVEGGRDGRTAGVFIKRAGDDRFRLFTEACKTVSPSKFANIVIRQGDHVMIERAGGAGYGRPEEREPELVLRDVTEGFASEESARADYRVAVRRENGRVLIDEPETERLRAAPP